MLVNRITSNEDEKLEKLFELYLKSFPLSERRSVKQIECLIENQANMYFNSIEVDDVLCGFLVYWKIDKMYYLEYLAVFENMRNLKIGEKLLGWIEENLHGLRVFEVEPPTDEMSTRRLNFYKRNGYEVIDTTYKQPSYSDDNDDLPLWVMSNQNPENVEEIINRLKFVIYYSCRKKNL